MKDVPTPKAIYQRAIEQYFECKPEDYSIVESELETGVTALVREQKIRVETLSDRTIICARLLSDMLGARLVSAVVEELDEIAEEIEDHPEFFFELIKVIDEDFFSHRVAPAKTDLALALGMCSISGLPLWETLSRLDNDLAAAGLVAAGRIRDRGALARTLAKVYFRRGEEYLVEWEGGLFAAFTCGRTKVIIYEVENRE